MAAGQDGDALKICSVRAYHIRPGRRGFLDDNKCRSFQKKGLDYWLSAESADQQNPELEARLAFPKTGYKKLKKEQGGPCNQFKSIQPDGKKTPAFGLK